METFAASKTDRHPTELAMLRGARLVTAVETEQGRPWAESKIKMLTGGDPVPARFMNQNFFEYLPQFALFIVGNHKPSLRSVDKAMKRRMHLVPFQITIADNKVDRDLSEKLKAEQPGILQWMIDGCLEYQCSGLAPPTAVTEATEAYLKAEDTISLWIEDRCQTGSDVQSKSSVLYESFRSFVEASGERAISQKAFSEALVAKGWKKVHTNIGTIFAGITVKPEELGDLV